ncbi:MAG: RidA family protein [Burkholderiaceae bacterium]|nr:RidA family protein [Burkholderiaceae bacterium]
MNITPIQAPDSAKPFGVWSQAVAVDGACRLLFISGLTARDASGAVVGEQDIEVQTRQVCENLAKVCHAAGGSLADIVNVTVYVRNVQDFAAIHRVRKAFFAQRPPASAMVEVLSLVDPRCLIEISAIAALPSPIEFNPKEPLP